MSLNSVCLHRKNHGEYQQLLATRFLISQRSYTSFSDSIYGFICRGTDKHPTASDAAIISLLEIKPTLVCPLSLSGPCRNSPV